MVGGEIGVSASTVKRRRIAASGVGRSGGGKGETGWGSDSTSRLEAEGDVASRGSGEAEWRDSGERFGSSSE